MPDVRIVDVDADTLDAVLEVRPRPGQEAWVRPVAWYVAKAAYDGGVWQPLALLSEGQVVGFAQTAFDPGDGSWAIGGVVVDAEQQGRGIGRAAIEGLIDRLRADPRCRLVALAVAEDNTAARELYRSLGFVPTGDRDDDELVMVLAPNAPNAPDAPDAQGPTG
ncbi:MAG: GNAT family N-acetyltransferase [Sporichthyaceae bacterium]